jgi:hypothetical protein
MRIIAVNGYKIPLYSNKAQAGFPSFAEDYRERALNLNEHLIKKSCFYLMLNLLYNV